jgi:hypothetical protein
MWEMIERMASDRLWIYTSIAGSIAGAMVLAYLSTTRIGIWGYAQFDRVVDYLVARWGLTWLEQPDDAWRKKYPKITAKIDDLESRIAKIENTKNK